MPRPVSPKMSPSPTPLASHVHPDPVMPKCRMTHLVNLAIDVFGDAERAEAWLTTPRLLGEHKTPHTPLEVALADEAGAALIETTLHRVAHGMP